MTGEVDRLHEELEQLTAFHQYQQQLRRGPSPPLSPNANPYMPTPNKIISNRNHSSQSRPSSTALTGPGRLRPGTSSTGAPYDAATLQAMQLLGGTLPAQTPAPGAAAPMDMSKSMPNIRIPGAGPVAGPGVFSSAASATLDNIQMGGASPKALPAVTAPAAAPGSSTASSTGQSSPSAARRRKAPRSTSTAKSLYIGRCVCTVPVCSLAIASL